MENYPITITNDQDTYHFEVGEYLHHDGENCKVKVFENGVLVVSFFPDEHECLHICQNPGGLNDQLLNLLADEIEAHHPLTINDNVKRLKL